MKELAIIILDWNGAEDTIECLDCLEEEKDYDIFLVDNGSQKQNVDKIKKYIVDSKYGSKSSYHYNTIEMYDIKPLNYVVLNDNIGFARGNNFVAERIADNYEYLLCLNNDTYIPKGTIQHMLMTAKLHENVALTCEIRKYYEKDKLWNAGGRFTFYGDRKYFSDKYINKQKNKGKNYINAQFITGCALLVRGSYIKTNGLFSDRFFHGEEDFNFCYKLKGMPGSIGVDLGVLLYHKVGRTIKRENDLNKEYNRAIIHYLNRVIDYKHFFTHIKWVLWRKFYLSLLFIHFIIDYKRIKISHRMIKRIRDLSDLYDNVQKRVFLEVMAYNW